MSAWEQSNKRKLKKSSHPHPFLSIELRVEYCIFPRYILLKIKESLVLKQPVDSLLIESKVIILFLLETS